MAYGGAPRVPHLSNPSVAYNGLVTGSSNQNNAQALNNTASTCRGVPGIKWWLNTNVHLFGVAVVAQLRVVWRGAIGDGFHSGGMLVDRLDRCRVAQQRRWRVGIGVGVRDRSGECGQRAKRQRCGGRGQREREPGRAGCAHVHLFGVAGVSELRFQRRFEVCKRHDAGGMRVDRHAVGERVGDRGRRRLGLGHRECVGGSEHGERAVGQPGSCGGERWRRPGGAQREGQREGAVNSQLATGRRIDWGGPLHTTADKSRLDSDLRKLPDNLKFTLSHLLTTV